MFTTRTALVSAATVVLVGLGGSPSTGSPTCACSPPSHFTTVQVTAAAGSAFAVPLQALAGRTLAQYLDDHMAPRLSFPDV